jgi:hypothetical protein
MILPSNSLQCILMVFAVSFDFLGWLRLFVPVVLLSDPFNLTFVEAKMALRDILGVGILPLIIGWSFGFITASEGVRSAGGR